MVAYTVYIIIIMMTSDDDDGTFQVVGCAKMRGFHPKTFCEKIGHARFTYIKRRNSTDLWDHIPFSMRKCGATMIVHVE